MQKFWMSAAALVVMAGEAGALEKCRDWSWQKGSRKSAQIALNANVCLAAQGSQNLVNEVKASGSADGYLLNNRIPLLRTEAGTKSDLAKNLQLSAGVFVAGQKVWGPQLNVATPEYEQSFHLPALDVEFPYTAQLGPIGVKVAAGVRGSAGADLRASAKLAQLQARLVPKLDSSGYALADFDVWLAYVGAEGRLLFARGQVDLEGSTEVVMREQKALLTGSVRGDYDLQTLDGAISIYADTKAARRRGVHSWERQLVSFDGFAVQGRMFEAAIPEIVIY